VLNAKLVTVNNEFSILEAAAIREGRFVAAGSNSDIKKLIGERTRVMDVHGKTVIPGLIESHVHALGVARDEAVQPFIQLSSVPEIQQWVREQARKTPAGEWIQIPRIDLTRLQEGRLPTRFELDVLDHPVVFNWQYGSRQIQVLNTAALRAANITRDTPAPAGGKAKLLKDAHGELTGVLENPGALTSRFLKTKPISDEAFLTALKKVHQSYNRIGITSIKHFIGLADWSKGGLKVAINSDHMFGIDPNKSLNPFNPFLAMYVAVTRKTESGRVIGPEQKISRAQALRMATINAAYLSFDEKRKGSIEVGKLGDFAVLSDDLLTCEPERIKAIESLATLVGGKLVHEAALR